MAVRETPSDRGAARGRRLMIELGLAAEEARLDRGLSYRALGRAMHVTGEPVARICRGQSPEVTIVRMAQLLETVGLTLSARPYPGGAPLRDRGHVDLLDRLRRRLPSTLQWSVEVPVVPISLPGPPDLRAWDAVIAGHGWRIGVEAETHVRDSQGLCRRASLKLRDGDVDAVVLLLTDSRWHRELLRLAGSELRSLCPIGPRRAFQALSDGRAPAGSALIIL